MKKFIVEYAITGYGYANVYTDGDVDDLNIIYGEFSCNSFKDLTEGLEWQGPEVIDIEEVELDEDEEDEDD
jgi:hypothetical protein